MPKNVAKGFTLGFTAYLIWGSFPLIIKGLGFASPWEIVVWRIFFGLLAGMVFIAFARSFKNFFKTFSSPKAMGWITISSIVIMINWIVYVYGVAIGHVVETSLGYFINPLVTIVIAVLVLAEKLRPIQWAAVSLGALAVILLTVDYGRLPWVALTLAVSFGVYGLAKNKMADMVEPLHSYTIETILLTPIAVIMLVAIAAAGPLAFFTEGPLGQLGLASYGVMTAIPLILFGAAAKHLPLSWIGFMQYFTPTIQFLMAIFLFKEEMPPTRWVGFGLVWAGLALLSADVLKRQSAKR